MADNKKEMKRHEDTAKPALLRTLPDAGDRAMFTLKKSLSDPKYNIFYDAPLLIFVSPPKAASESTTAPWQLKT